MIPLLSGLARLMSKYATTFVRLICPAERYLPTGLSRSRLQKHPLRHDAAGHSCGLDRTYPGAIGVVG
jgi:hypothetical protein